VITLLPGRATREICRLLGVSCTLAVQVELSKLAMNVSARTSQDPRQDASPVRRKNSEQGTAMKNLLASLMLCMPLSTACADSSIDELVIHRDARDVKKYSFPESNSRQISYSVNLKYPATALTDATFAEIKKLGWSKCSGYPGKWDSYVDASKGKDREQTIFQNNSYWFKGTTLLTISMRYYAGVTKNTHRLKVPDNTQQQVVVLENTNPVVKEKLGITCPQGSTTK